MIHFVSLLVLAFAVSLDSFGAGITYGMRKITIPIHSIFIIALCSGLMILIAMSIGQGISMFISPSFAKTLGGFILIGIGVWALYNVYHSREVQPILYHTEDKATEKVEMEEKHVWSIEFKKMGIVIQILRKPMMADIDRSGVISPGEAVVLGTALALDAFGAGIGAALIGFSPWSTAFIIAVMSSLFIFLGMKCGVLFSEATWMKKLIYIPGIILVTLGVMKLL